jgi:hypothetical protein
MTLRTNENGEEVFVSKDVRFNIKKSKDSLIRIEVRKEANGPSFDEAKATSEKIDYGYKVEGNALMLNDFLTTARDNKFMDQEVRANLYLPVGTTFGITIGNSNRCWTIRTENDQDMDGCEASDYLWKMGEDGELDCQDCPQREGDEADDNERNRVIINEDGIDINIKDNGESFKMKIDENGVDIKAKDSENNR